MRTRDLRKVPLMPRRFLLGAALLLLAGIALLLVRRLLLDQRALSPNYGSAATDPRLSRPARLSGFPLRRQAHPYSCGPATISMVLSYLDAPVTEEQYSARAGLSGRQEGMPPHVFLRYLQAALPSRSVELVTDEAPLDVLRLIQSQLAAGVPVPIYFSTVDPADPKTTDTHYSAVTGMDLPNGVIHVANVYGYEEDVPLSVFFAGLSFRNHRSEPFGHTIARLTGYIAKNNLYIISPVRRASSSTGGVEGRKTTGRS